MRNVFVLAGLAICAGLAVYGGQSPGEWEQFHGTHGNTGRASVGPDLSRYATPRLTVGDGNVGGVGMDCSDWWAPDTILPNASGPVVAEGKVFCYDDAGRVVAFRESTGVELWSTPIAAGMYMSSSSPSYSNGRVYIGSDNTVYCLEAQDGAVVWTHVLTAPDNGTDLVVNAAVTIAEDAGLCYIHTFTGMGASTTRLVAINIADGTLAWTRDVSGLGQGHVAYNPALKLVYTTITDARRGRIAALNAQTGATVWTSADSFDLPCSGGVAFDANRDWVVAAGYNAVSEFCGILVCNATTGATVSYTGDGVAPAGNYTPVIDEYGKIYVSGAEWDFALDGIYTAAFDGVTGAQLWQTDSFDFLGTWSASPVYAQDNGSNRRVIYCPFSALWKSVGAEAAYAMVSADTGNILATVPMPGGTAAIVNGNLYFINADHNLVAFGPPVHVIDVDVAGGEYGSVSPARSHSVTNGGSVTFTFTGDVKDVLVNGVSVGAAQEYTLSNVTADSTLSVAFYPPARPDTTGGWEQFHGSNGNNGRALRGPDLRIYNTPRFTSVDDVGGGGMGFGAGASGPVVADGKVFAFHDSGTMFAFNESTGAKLWETEIEPTGFGSWSSPSASNGKVYMGSGGSVYCLDAETGDIHWTYALTTMDGHGETYGMVVNAAVTIAEDIGLCYMHTYGSFGGGTRLHAINIADGTMAWTQDMTGQGQGHVAYNPALKYVYTTVGTEGGWANGRGGIKAFDARTGAVMWTSADSFTALNFGGIAFDAGLNWVVAAGYSFSDYTGLLVCDATTGATISYTGDYAAPSGDYTPVIGEDGVIYVCGAEWQDGPFVFAFDGYTGEWLWQSDAGFGTWNVSPAYAQDNGSGKGVVYCTAVNWSGLEYGMFSAADGALLASVPMGGGNAAIANGNLYFVNDESKLVAFGPAVHFVDVEYGAFGAVSPARGQGVEDGGSITFTFTDNVAEVFVDDVSVGAPASYTLTHVNADHTVRVVFAIPQHTIHVERSPYNYGTMSPTTSQTVNEGDSVTFTFGPEVVDVLVDGVSIGAMSAYTFANVTQDHTLRAVFDSPFAVALVDELTFGPFHGNTSLWGTPEYVLGKPVVADRDDTSWSNPVMRPICLAWPAWYKGTTNPEHIGLPYSSIPAGELTGSGTGLRQGGQIVVEFAQAVTNDARNPFGIDFIVHGNSFFVAETGMVYPNSDMEDVILTDSGSIFSEPVTVSVAQYPEGPWYTYTTPTADGLYPTQPFAWNRDNHTWGAEQDWTKPVDPMLTAADFGGLTAADAIDLYDGSAGGTGFSLAESGFDWIRYVKLTDPNGDEGEITGLVKVSPYLGTYALTAIESVKGGLDIASGQYDSGARLTVTAQPAPGYTFSHWVTLPPNAVIDGDQATFIVNRAITLEATFVLSNPAALDYEAWLEHYTLDDTTAHHDAWIAGLDPLDTLSQFVILIEMINGKPSLSWLPDLGELRVYTLEAKEDLRDEDWIAVDPDNIPDNVRFFRAHVNLP